MGDVLKDDVGDAGVGAGVIDARETRPVPEDPADVLEVGAELTAKLEHPLRDVECDNGGRAGGDGAGLPAGPAADLHDVVGGTNADAEPVEHRVQRTLPVLE